MLQKIDKVQALTSNMVQEAVPVHLVINVGTTEEESCHLL
jgi:hypothetical protein